ncbi:MAG TPA: hypothetical protein DEQ09_12980 [Bacteroidales bacterium]|nr:hypothetical protein [Bacteroidales bacterium]
MGQHAVKILKLDTGELIKMLNDELEHEEDIEAWLADLERMKEGIRILNEGKVAAYATPE